MQGQAQSKFEVYGPVIQGDTWMTIALERPGASADRRSAWAAARTSPMASIPMGFGSSTAQVRRLQDPVRATTMIRTARATLTLALAAAGATLALAPRAQAQDQAITAALNEAYNKFRNLNEGKNADYIPALAKVDPKIFGIALVTTDGKVYTAGDVKSEVSIQSISKVFTLAKVIEEQGPEAIEKTIGVDATGMRFNSIVAVEMAQKALGDPEMNSLVNPGAIATTSMVKGGTRDEVWKSLLGFYSDFAGRPLSVNQEVFKSEAETNQRNQAIGSLMYAYGYIKDKPDQATDVYTEQCSVSVNAKDLAMMAATLANGGKSPVTKKQAMAAANVPYVLAVMATAGLYDDSGKWLYHTGLPAKSGVGGGIIAVAPGKFGIAVISPPLDDAGNSVRAQKAITEIVARLGANPYAVKPS
jgi:glutaminase